MDRKQFLLRIDRELWQELEEWAADDLRSVNAQVEWLLREAARKRRGGRGRHERPARESADKDDDERGDGPAADAQRPRSATSVDRR
jgi:hypothetical protein